MLAAASVEGRDRLKPALARIGSDLLELEAEGAGVMHIGPGGASFPDPSARSRVYRAARQVDRAAAHRALAAVNRAAGDMDRWAWHLRLADLPLAPAIAELVERVALEGKDGRDLAAAAAILEETAHLVGDPTAAVAITVRAARMQMAAGQPGPAYRLARAVIEGAAGGPADAGAVLVLGRSMLTGGREAEGRRFLLHEAGARADREPGPAAVMLCHVAASAMRSGCPQEALSAARRAAELAPPMDGYARLVSALALGAALTGSGNKEEGLAVLPDPVTVVERIDVLSEGVLAVVTAGGSLIWAEQYDQARQLLDALEVRSRTVGALDPLPAVLAARALCEHRICRWPSAATAAAEALDLARAAGQPTIARWASSVLATVEAAQGRTVECRQRCLQLLDPATGGSDTLARSSALAALGLLELGDGHFEAAIHWYEVLAGSAGPATRPVPSVNMWEADLAEAYIGAGRRAEADEVLRSLEERSRRSGNRRAAAAVMRNRAMLAEDAGTAAELFDQVRAAYQGPTWRFARARTELAYGTRLMADGRLEAAARVLTEARDRFDQMGARGWAARAAQHLERASAAGPARPVPGPSLTPLEIRTAMAAALGSGLADIAAGLFLDEATADAHLRRAMDKLGVSGPAELERLLPTLALAAPDSPPSSAPRPPVAGLAGGGEAPRPLMTIRLLGGFAVTDRGERAELHDGITAQAVKMVALAAKVPAEELIEQLWPETDPDVGRSRLRSLLARLRRSCRPILVRQGSWIVLADDVVVDVDEFERHAGETLASLSAGGERAPELARRALGLYSGELLPTDRHLDFTVGPRERLRRRYLALADLVIEDHRRAGRLEEAVRLLEEAIATDPYDGQLYLRAASMLAGAGRASEASSVIRRAELALGELGLRLPPAAEELRRSL